MAAGPDENALELHAVVVDLPAPNLIGERVGEIPLAGDLANQQALIMKAAKALRVDLVGAPTDTIVGRSVQATRSVRSRFHFDRL